MKKIIKVFIIFVLLVSVSGIAFAKSSLTVSLASTNPKSKSVDAGAINVVLAHFQVKNSYSSDIRVSDFVLNEEGTQKGTINNLALYDVNGNQLGKTISAKDGVYGFYFGSSGYLFTVKKDESYTVVVKGNIPITAKNNIKVGVSYQKGGAVDSSDKGVKIDSNNIKSNLMTINNSANTISGCNYAKKINSGLGITDLSNGILNLQSGTKQQLIGKYKIEVCSWGRADSGNYLYKGIYLTLRSTYKMENGAIYYPFPGYSLENVNAKYISPESAWTVKMEAQGSSSGLGMTDEKEAPRDYSINKTHPLTIEVYADVPTLPEKNDNLVMILDGFSYSIFDWMNNQRPAMTSLDTTGTSNKNSDKKS